MINNEAIKEKIWMAVFTRASPNFDDFSMSKVFNRTDKQKTISFALKSNRAFKKRIA